MSVRLPPLSQTLGQTYPEREEPHADEKLEQIGSALTGMVSRSLRARRGRARSIVKQVRCVEGAFKGLELAELREQARELKLKLRREGMRDDLVAQAFALVREAAGSTVGMRHFDTQLIGGWVMLGGMIAEM